MFLSQHVSLGPLTLNLYPLLIALAVLVCVLIEYWRTKDARVFATALFIGAIALVFGRAGYIALNWEYFREHANDIVSFGGLSEHGAIVGGLIGYWLLTRRVPLSEFSILNSQFSISVAASLGCIPNGCAYGREVFWQTDGANSLAWLLRADWPDAYLVNNPRWPTQVLLAGWLLVSAALLFALTKRRGDTEDRASQVSLSVLSFGVGDFLVQFLRGDAAIMVAGLRAYQWLDVLLMGLALALYAVSARQPNPHKL